MYAKNEDLYREWFDLVWNEKREDVIDIMMAADGIAHGMGPNGADLIGTEGFKTAFRLFTGAFPDLRISVTVTVAGEDKVAGHIVCSGTHLGSHLGVAPTGKPVKFHAMTIVRYRDGLIIEGWNCIDFGSLFQQVGILSPVESLP